MHQCLASVQGATDVARLLLTASGGPFRGWTAERLAGVTVADALAHPTWSMGPKITVDSSTLMNKGLEVIEAHELFGVDYDRIDIVVHPQSIVHSMVELRDGSTLAQLADTDMRLPIGYALGWPDRVDVALRRARLVRAADLDLRAARPGGLPLHRSGLRGGPQRRVGPGLAERGQRGRRGGVPRGRLPWNGIADVVAETLEGWVDDHVDQVEGVLAADAAARSGRLRSLARRMGRGGAQ